VRVQASPIYLEFKALPPSGRRATFVEMHLHVIYIGNVFVREMEYNYQLELLAFIFNTKKFAIEKDRSIQ